MRKLNRCVFCGIGIEEPKKVCPRCFLMER
mgnify:CR=1 FL=1|jgi:NMD protein affecting ribosome stability and mRNA decay